MSIIEVKDLTKYYGKSRGVKNLNFSVDKGEIFGFIGPNGAGKSTTIRCMLNLIYPTEGHISICGLNAVNDSIKVKNITGYLPSECNFYGDMKVKEFLIYVSSYYKGDFNSRIDELSSRLQLDGDKKIEDLSYGNKKKVGIIQALLHDPQLLILDEPTGGLDPLIQEEFYKILEEEKLKGKTIFFSSHILSEVQRLCDRVAIIKDGEIIKIEKIENLRTKKAKKIKMKSKEDIVLNIDGVKDICKSNNSIEFIFNGDINSLIKLISNYNIEDMLIEDPTLEEIFMNYYEN